MTHLISHRGNLTGKQPTFENKPDYVHDAMMADYDVEVDVWFKDDKWWLGHDEPKYEINLNFLCQPRLWAHCKNIEALSVLRNYHTDVHYFWHQEDDYTLTSRGYIWAYPGKPAALGSRTVCVLPELNNQDIKNFGAICSDIIKEYDKR